MTQPEDQAEPSKSCNAIGGSVLLAAGHVPFMSLAMAVPAESAKLAFLHTKPLSSSGKDMAALIQRQVAVWTDAKSTDGIQNR